MRRPLLALLLASCAAPPAPAPEATQAPVAAAAATSAPVPAAASSASAATSAPVPTAAAAAPPRATFEPLGADETRRLVEPHLDGKKLAQPAVRGPFGPSPDDIVAVTTTSDNPPMEYGGFVLTPDGRVLPLPKLHDHWSGWEAHALLFEDVAGGGKALILVAEYVTNAGPQGAVPFYFDAVVRWDGQGFARMPEVEKRLGRLSDPAAIRKALQAGAGKRAR
jgi:hypothetical protein